MKTTILILVSLLSAPVLADTIGTTTPAGTSFADSSGGSSDRKHPYWQTLTFQAGPYRPQSLAISNSTYDFQYSDDSLNSYQIIAGWGAKLFQFHGSALWVGEGMTFSPFQGQLAAGQTNSANAQDVHLYLFGLDSRLRYSAEWLPWRFVIPFVEGGYRYTFYTQSGSSDAESAQGGIGNAVAAAGVSLWINPSSTQTSIPLFLTASAQRIFPRPAGLDLGSTTFTAGFTLGL